MFVRNDMASQPTRKKPVVANLPCISLVLLFFSSEFEYVTTFGTEMRLYTFSILLVQRVPTEMSLSRVLSFHQHMQLFLS
jgi:hypothetical protein